MKIGLVHNPGAGNGSSPSGEIEALLRDGGYEPVVLPRDDAALESARSAGVAFVVVAGGDGTLRKTALSFVGSGIPLAPLPTGTANNIGKSLGIVAPPEAIIGAWSVERQRRMDVGRARGPWGERHFLEGCGIGLIGRGIALITEIDAATTRRFAEPQDKLHRDLSVYVALVTELAPQRVGLVLDGAEVRDDYLLVEVLNIQHAGPRIHLSRRADPGDGLLDVVVATARDRDKLHYNLKTCLAGSRPDPVLDSARARRVTLAFTGSEFRIDDEVMPLRHEAGSSDGAVTIELSVVADALRILAPDGNGAPG